MRASTILSRAGDFWGEILVFFGCSPNVSRARRTDPYRAHPSTADEFEVAFGVPRDPARVAEAAVGAPSRQPLADVTARYVPPTVREPCPEEYQQPAVLPPAPFFFFKAQSSNVGRARENARIAQKEAANR